MACHLTAEATIARTTGKCGLWVLPTTGRIAQHSSTLFGNILTKQHHAFLSATTTMSKAENKQCSRHEVSLAAIGCVSSSNNSLRTDTQASAACQTQHSLQTISITTIGTTYMDARQKSHLLLAYISRMVRKHLLNNV